MKKILLHRFESTESPDSDPRFTLRDGDSGELMHSDIGAAAEAETLYGVPGSRHLQRFFPNGGRAVAWDVAAGTGSNAVALIDAWAGGTGGPNPLEILSFELHPETLAVTLENLDSFPHLLPYRAELTALRRDGHCEGTRAGRTFHWTMRLGDFHETLAGAAPADLILWDFYSPRAAPDPWRAPLLARVREICTDHPTLLLTYVSATWVRIHLSAAGFFLGEGARTVRKTQTTEAGVSATVLSRPLPAEWAAKIERSTHAEVHAEVMVELRARALAHPQWKFQDPE